MAPGSDWPAGRDERLSQTLVDDAARVFGYRSPPRP
jgi:hypothetical protein